MGKWKSLIILKEIKNLEANLCAFGLKPNGDWNFSRKFLNLHPKITMENRLFTHFLAHLPGPLPFSTPLENNTIFYNNSFGFGGYSPLPARGRPALKNKHEDFYSNFSVLGKFFPSPSMGASVNFISKKRTLRTKRLYRISNPWNYL